MRLLRRNVGIEKLPGETEVGNLVESIIGKFTSY